MLDDLYHMYVPKAPIVSRNRSYSCEHARTVTKFAVLTGRRRPSIASSITFLSVYTSVE